MNTRPDIREYYRHTRFDYRVAWSAGKGAVHFGYYDEHASRHADALDNMNRAMADAAGVMPGHRVLDAGCGQGNACFWLAENRQAGVTGISIVPEQIADCRKRLRKCPLPNVHFETADYLHTPFPDASFDVVWACESLCHAADKSAFYREAFRLLRPGGRLVAAEYLRTARPLPAASENLLQRWLNAWAIPDLDTAAEHEACARAAGFARVQLRDVTPQVRVSLRNLHEICTNWRIFGKILRFLHIVNDIRLNNLLGSITQYEALQNGAWHYGFITAFKSNHDEFPAE